MCYQFSHYIIQKIFIQKACNSLIDYFRFFQKETAVTIREYATYNLPEDEDIPFIDLIICPEYFAAYNREKLEYYGIDKEKYKFMGYFTPQQNGNGTDPRKIFYEVTHDVEEIFDRMRIKTLNKKIPEIHIDFNEGDFRKHINITTKFWNNFGRCYSIIPKRSVQKLGIVDIIFEAKMSIYVYFGHPGQFLAANRNSKVI